VNKDPFDGGELLWHEEWDAFGPADRPPSQSRRSRRRLLAAWASVPLIIAVRLLVAGFGHSGAAGLAHARHQSVSNERQLTLAQYRPGVCVLSAGSPLGAGSYDGWPAYTTAVPCDRGHRIEVVYAGYYWGNGAHYPGYDRIVRTSLAACQRELASYAGTKRPGGLMVDAIVPNQVAWGMGGAGRQLICFAWFSSARQPDGAVTTGSIRSQAASRR
jgi:hypothetical protein